MEELLGVARLMFNDWNSSPCTH